MRRKIGAIAIVVIVVICAIGVALVYTMGTGRSSASADFTTTDLQKMTWGDVLSKARGETVNFYFRGGSTTINNYVDQQVAKEAAKYGIAINRVAVTDASVFVNKIAGRSNRTSTAEGRSILSG